MALHYTEKVLEYFKNPRNVGEIRNPDGKATEGSPACGDMITTYIRVDDATHRILEVKFKSYGCASNIATASVISEKAVGKTTEEVEQMDYATAARELGGLPAVKMHCSVLAVNALKAAITDYKIKKGIIERREFVLNSDAIMSELLHVINPDMGVNIVRLHMVKNIGIADGNVLITISLGTTDSMYAPAIREDVMERIAKLPGVKSVKVEIES